MRLVVLDNNGRLYDISELVIQISYTDQLNDGCSKLEFSYINGNLIIENGNEIRFDYENLSFNGKVFKVSRDKGKEIKVTVYDRLRYIKAKDYIVISQKKLSDVIGIMSTRFKYSKGYIEATGYTLATNVYDGSTWLDIIYDGIAEEKYRNNKFYVLRDEAGFITLRNIEDLKLNLILGDQSLCYDFSYEKSIDEDFYNQVVIHYKKDKVSGMASAYDNSSQNRYGMLQYYEVKEGLNKTQADDYAKVLLKLYNQESESLSLECLGDSRIRAGNSFLGYIADIMDSKYKWMIVKSVTHDFIPVHTMKIEVKL